MDRKSLAEWLDYQQRTHPRSIELGLTRVAEVWRRMGAPRPAPLVITVGGTNGKGSTVAFLEAMLAADGKRVGCYTSPHLQRYNERVRVLGRDIDDAALVAAFDHIEAARRASAGAGSADEIPLTYFEFGTLAALWIFSQSGLDVAVLEVGLGGRLDAVNIIDADAAIVVTVDLDHQDWLGNDRDSIGREKAGILRRERPAIIGMRKPPGGLLDEAARIGARVVQAGRDFSAAPGASGWCLHIDGLQLALPTPALAAACQVDNAAAAIAALHSLRARLGWNPAALADGVRNARLPARIERFATGAGEVIVDVAHNPQAAGVLSQWLLDNPARGRTLAVFAALADKDTAGIIAPLRGCIDTWLLAGLDQATSRGITADDLLVRAADPLRGADVRMFVDPRRALDHALANLIDGDRIVAFGSFFVAAAVLERVGTMTAPFSADVLARQV